MWKNEILMACLVSGRPQS